MTLLSTLFSLKIPFQTEVLDGNLVDVGTYNPWWVITSVLIAILASYAAFNASGRISHCYSMLEKLIWTVISSLTLGIGIWAMHFIGMLALNLQCHVDYNLLLTVISVFPVVLVSGVVLGISEIKFIPIWINSILLASGIGLTHYIGMGAMELDGAEISYNPTWFFLSIFVAIALSFIALKSRDKIILFGNKNIFSSIIMGFSASGTHYTAIFAMYFASGNRASLPTHHALQPMLQPNDLLPFVSIIAVFMALMSLTLAVFSRNKQIVRCLLESNSKNTALLNSMAEGAYGTDTDGYCSFVNHSFLRILGYEKEEDVIGKYVHELIHHSYADGTHYPSNECKIYNAYKHQKNAHVTDEVFWRKDGVAIPVEYWSQPVITNGVVTGAIATFIDITERQKYEKEIKMLAFHDVLTGLPNRRKLLDHMSDSIKLSRREGKKFAVFMMDLDKFKAVNDTLGHAAGDDLLKQVATRITKRLRESDMAARLGGDEFVVVLENCSTHEDAEIVASDLISDLTLPFKLSDGNVVQIGASIGISFYPQHGTVPEILIHVADSGLYQAKENGRGCFFFAKKTIEH